MTQKKLTTLEEYIEAYEKAIAVDPDINTMIIRPEIWIYFKWTDEEGIEYPGEPKYEEKIKELRKTNPKLARVIGVGAIEVEEMMNFLGGKN